MGLGDSWSCCHHLGIMRVNNDWRRLRQRDGRNLDNMIVFLSCINLKALLLLDVLSTEIIQGSIVCLLSRLKDTLVRQPWASPTSRGRFPGTLPCALRHLCRSRGSEAPCVSYCQNLPARLNTHCRTGVTLTLRLSSSQNG